MASSLRIEPLTLNPRSAEFADPNKYILDLYKDPQVDLEGRGAVLVNVPDRYVYDEAPEVDQSATLSWVVRQNLRPSGKPGMWVYSDIQTYDKELKAKKYLSKIDIRKRIDQETFWKTRDQSDVWCACFCSKPFFKNDDSTFKNLPAWNFSSVQDMMEESGVWGPRSRNYNIGSPGSCTQLTVEYANLGYLNFMHWGAPRIWTAIPAKYFRVLQNCIAEMSPISLETCPTLHTCQALYERSFFERQRIPTVEYEQKEGQLLIVSYQVQYQAIDTGANVAENCNFACENWLKYSTHQVKCTCGTGIETGVNLREYGFKEYGLDTKPEEIPDPTDNGKWYCARDGLPKKFRGIAYPKTEDALFGLPPLDSESEPPSTEAVERQSLESGSSSSYKRKRGRLSRENGENLGVKRSS